MRDKTVQYVRVAYFGINKVFDFRVGKSFTDRVEVFVTLVVDFAVRPEVRALYRVRVVACSTFFGRRPIGAGTDGDFTFGGFVQHFVEELLVTRFHAVRIVFLIGDRCRVRIIMHRRYGESEVPYRFGVDTVYLDAKNVVRLPFEVYVVNALKRGNLFGSDTAYAFNGFTCIYLIVIFRLLLQRPDVDDGRTGRHTLQYGLYTGF